MIHILEHGATLPVTPKGSVRRKEVEQAHGEQLSRLYEQLEGGSTLQRSDLAHDGLSDPDYIARCAQDVFGADAAVSRNTNFYRVGLDSQKAIRLRSALMKRFGKFPLLYLYEYPSVNALSKALGKTVTVNGHTVDNNRTEEHHRYRCAWQRPSRSLCFGSRRSESVLRYPWRLQPVENHVARARLLARNCEQSKVRINAIRHVRSSTRA